MDSTILQNFTLDRSNTATAIFFCTFIAGLFIAKLYIGTYKKKGKNPFCKDFRTPQRNLVLDHKERDKVLKQGFSIKKLPDDPDVIIVGSGIGALCTATLLTRADYKVLVLEQHDQAGGCCHSFVEKGYEFDAGIHYIGEMQNKTVLRALIDQLTAGQLEWVSLDQNYDVVALGEASQARRIPIMAGREQFRDTLLKHFPKEQRAIDNYIALLKEIRKSVLGLVLVKSMPKWVAKLLAKTGLLDRMTSYFKYSRIPLSQTLAELTDDIELRATLAYCFGDYGTPPSEASTAMHGVLVNHFLYGVSYPKGGSSEIAFNIIPEIEAGGGAVLVRAPVTEIMVEGGAAVGVKVEKSGQTHEIRSRYVISDAGIYNTFQTLLPPHVAQNTDIYQKLKRLNLQACGALSLFVGLEGSTEELQLEAKNMWAFTSPHFDKTCEAYMSKTLEDVIEEDVPLLFISFPSSKDPTWPQRYPGKSVCTVVTLARWEWFSQWERERVMKRGPNYTSLKMALAHRMWDQCVRLYPQLEGKVDYFDIGTPLSNKYYLGSPKGEIYGLDHNVDRFREECCIDFRPQTQIPNLYLTGQDVFTCGFAGAMFGGLLCASQILNRNLYDDLNVARKTFDTTASATAGNNE